MLRSSFVVLPAPHRVHHLYLYSILSGRLALLVVSGGVEIVIVVVTVIDNWAGDGYRRWSCDGIVDVVVRGSLMLASRMLTWRMDGMDVLMVYTVYTSRWVAQRCLCGDHNKSASMRGDGAGCILRSWCSAASLSVVILCQSDASQSRSRWSRDRVRRMRRN